MHKGKSSEEKKNILLSIQAAIRESYQIEHNKFHFRINEYDETNMFVSPAQSKNYVLIELDYLPNRSKAVKNELYDTLKLNLAVYDIETDDILVIIRDNWSKPLMLV